MSVGVREQSCSNHGMVLLGDGLAERLTPNMWRETNEPIPTIILEQENALFLQSVIANNILQSRLVYTGVGHHLR